MNTSLPALSSYGPRQSADRLDLSEWQWDRGRRLGLIPAPDHNGHRWSAPVFDALASRIEEIRPQLGTLPDLGAGRAEDHLADRFPGLTIHRGTAAELHRRGHLPVRGDYRGHPLYCGLALEAFRDRRKAERASAAGRLHMQDAAAAELGIRKSDLDHLIRAGLLTHSEMTEGWHHTVVRLYRQADLDRLKRSSRIDLDAVRATPKSHRSLLAALPTARQETQR
jgi:hypothetical protein